MLTYRKLLKLIEKLPEEHKDDNVTVHIYASDEFYPVVTAERVEDGECDGAGVLDTGHLYLEVM